MRGGLRAPSGDKSSPGYPILNCTLARLAGTRDNRSNAIPFAFAATSHYYRMSASFQREPTDRRNTRNIPRRCVRACVHIYSEVYTARNRSWYFIVVSFHFPGVSAGNDTYRAGNSIAIVIALRATRSSCDFHVPSWRVTRKRATARFVPACHVIIPFYSNHDATRQPAARANAFVYRVYSFPALPGAQLKSRRSRVNVSRWRVITTLRRVCRDIIALGNERLDRD